jgi:hypothetical protein
LELDRILSIVELASALVENVKGDLLDGEEGDSQASAKPGASEFLRWHLIS